MFGWKRQLYPVLLLLTGPLGCCFPGGLTKLVVSVIVSLLSWLSEDSAAPSPRLNQFTKVFGPKSELALAKHTYGSPIPPSLDFDFCFDVDGSEIPKAFSLCLGVKM